jgi:hypothetical protein
MGTSLLDRIGVDIVAQTQQLDQGFESGIASTKDFVQKLKAELAASTAQIQAATKAGLLTPEQARSAAEAAGKAYATALEQSIRSTQQASAKTPAEDALKSGRLASLTAELGAFKNATAAIATETAAAEKTAAAAADRLGNFARAAQTAGGPVGGLAGQVGGLSESLATGPAAAGLFGAALVALGAHAVAMASEVESAAKAVDREVGLTAAQAAANRQDVEAFSIAAGRSQQDILRLMQGVAQNGPGGAAGLRAMTQAALELSEVTGGDAGSIANGLDGLLDAFGRSAEEAPQIAAELREITKGKVPLEDLLATLDRVAANARASGLSLEEIAAAAANLRDANVPMRQVKSELEALAGAGADGAARIRELAGQVPAAADAMAKLQQELAAVRSENEHVAQSLHQALNAEMIALGREGSRSSTRGCTGWWICSGRSTASGASAGRSRR